MWGFVRAKHTECGQFDAIYQLCITTYSIYIVEIQCCRLIIIYCIALTPINVDCCAATVNTRAAFATDEEYDWIKWYEYTIYDTNDWIWCISFHFTETCSFACLRQTTICLHIDLHLDISIDEIHRFPNTRLTTNGTHTHTFIDHHLLIWSI